MAVNQQDIFKIFGNLVTALREKDRGTIVKLLPLVKAETRWGKFEQNLLHLAVAYDASKEVFELIIQKFKAERVSLDATYDGHWSALDFAFSVVCMEGIQTLIEAGADYKRLAFPEIPGLKDTRLDFFLIKHPEKSELVTGFIRQREERMKEEAEQEAKKSFDNTKSNASGRSSRGFLSGLLYQFGYKKSTHKGGYSLIENARDADTFYTILSDSSPQKTTLKPVANSSHQKVE